MESSTPIALELTNKYSVMFEESILNGLKRIQERNNYTQGAYYIEIMHECEPETKQLARKGAPVGAAIFGFSNLVEKGVFLLSKECNEFSLKPLPGYRTFMEIIENDFKGLVWNPITKVLEQGTAPTVNFKQTVKLFLSKEGEMEAEKREFEEKLANFKEVFLDGEEIPRVILASLMRSGNTMFRRVFEQTSGIITGSTQQGNMPDQQQLTALGMKGEGVVDSKVWMFRTHFPYTNPVAITGKGSCAVVLVRCPIDCIVSHLYLAATNAHDLRVSNDVPKEFPKDWEHQVKHMSKVWNQFYNYYLDLGKKHEIPVFFLRFEDVVKDKYNALCDTYTFLLGVNDIKDTYLEKRIKDAVEKESFGSLYKQKEGGQSKNFEMFSEAYIAYIKRFCNNLIHFFGYSKFDGIENDPAGQFFYDEVKDADREVYGKFREFNMEQRKWYQEHREEIPLNQLEVETPGKDIGIKLKDEPFLRLMQQRGKFQILRK